jgi:hypothetical protein
MRKDPFERTEGNHVRTNAYFHQSTRKINNLQGSWCSGEFLPEELRSAK